MAVLLGLTLISFILTALAAIPFINLLYRLKFQRQQEVHVLSPIFTKLHAWKVGTPNSGGVLIILITVLMGWYFLQPELSFAKSPGLIIFLGLLLYGALGFYDDIKKYFGYQKDKFWGLRLRYKLILQIVFALILGELIFQHLGVNGLVSLEVPWLGNFMIPEFIYVAFAAFVIVASVNAFNITDGVDGLASGLLFLSLTSFLVIALARISPNLFTSPAIDQITQVIAIWMGAVLAFLYFNIYPARVWMGDSGALAFGGGLAVLALLLGVPFIFIVLGAVYVIETVSSLLQWYSMRYMTHKLFLIAPLHHHFEAKGWPETKVTMRFWLAGALASIFGLYLFFLLHNGL